MSKFIEIDGGMTLISHARPMIVHGRSTIEVRHIREDSVMKTVFRVKHPICLRDYIMIMGQLPIYAQVIVRHDTTDAWADDMCMQLAQFVSPIEIMRILAQRAANKSIHEGE